MQKLENLAEQTVFFFVLRLLRTDPLRILNTNEIETISSNVQKVCDLSDPYSIDVKEISIHCLIRPNKYDEDYDKAESYIQNIFSEEIDKDDISAIKSWAEEVADVWKDFNSYPPEYPGQQDWDMLPSPHKINWKK
tara:strand:- start:1338 stop:1745 length:408 start_codon:yes stop_codon:yes gene_type:complete